MCPIQNYYNRVDARRNPRKLDDFDRFALIFLFCVGWRDALLLFAGC